MAHRVGFEPTTTRLTVEGSTVELPMRVLVCVCFYVVFYTSTWLFMVQLLLANCRKLLPHTNNLIIKYRRRDSNSQCLHPKWSVSASSTTSAFVSHKGIEPLPRSRKPHVLATRPMRQELLRFFVDWLQLLKNC